MTTAGLTRVLVVDDDEVDRLAVRRALPRDLVTVGEADALDDAVHKLTTGTWDLALVDYFLPPSDGAALLARLKLAGVCVPVILLSGHGSEELVAEVMKAGAVDYLSKAAVAEPNRLWRTVQGALEVDRLQKQLALDAAGRREAEHEAAELRERLLGIVSHDLKNPLNAILQASSLLKRSGEQSEKSLRYLGHIHDSAERMTDIIVQLLDLTRARHGQAMAIEHRRFDLAPVLTQVADELRLAHADRSILSRGESLELSGDPGRLAQVASNLLANALSHGAHDAPVELSWAGTADEVEVSVRNRGEAIAAELLPLLFQPFFRGQAGRAREGLGLGLFIASEVVSAHHGRLDVQSTAEEGTCFTVHLPRWPAAAR